VYVWFFVVLMAQVHTATSAEGPAISILAAFTISSVLESIWNMVPSAPAFFEGVGATLTWVAVACVGYSGYGYVWPTKHSLIGYSGYGYVWPTKHSLIDTRVPHTFKTPPPLSRDVLIDAATGPLSNLKLHMNDTLQFCKVPVKQAPVTGAAYGSALMLRSAPHLQMKNVPVKQAPVTGAAYGSALMLMSAPHLRMKMNHSKPHSLVEIKRHTSTMQERFISWFYDMVELSRTWHYYMVEFALPVMVRLCCQRNTEAHCVLFFLRLWALTTCWVNGSPKSYVTWWYATYFTCFLVGFLSVFFLYLQIWETKQQFHKTKKLFNNKKNLPCPILGQAQKQIYHKKNLSCATRLLNLHIKHNVLQWTFVTTRCVLAVTRDNTLLEDSQWLSVLHTFSLIACSLLCTAPIWAHWAHKVQHTVDLDEARRVVQSHRAENI
jgi:hypothetical protein